MSVPASLAEIVDDFAALGDSDKVTLLLEFAGELPELPAELTTEAMEPVPECNPRSSCRSMPTIPTPSDCISVHPASADDARFRLDPASGARRRVGADDPRRPGRLLLRLGLGKAVSPLRLRGMAGMLGRIKPRSAARPERGRKPRPADGMKFIQILEEPIEPGGLVEWTPYVPGGWAVGIATHG